MIHKMRRCACSAEKNLTKGQVMLDKDLAEIYDYKGQKLEADILICTPFTGHPMKGIYIILYSF